MFVQWAIEANDQGDYFPVYAVCLGFELLSIIATKVSVHISSLNSHFLPSCTALPDSVP
jgi:hypothetical protein